MIFFWLFTSCTQHSPPKPLTRHLESTRYCDDSILLRPEAIQALRLEVEQDITRIPVQASSVDIIDSIFVKDKQGQLWFNDVVGQAPFQNQDKCKINLRNIEAKGIGASVDSQWRITPYSDVLRHLDTGIGLNIQIGERSETVRFAPNYDAALVAPYKIFGQSYSQAAAGFHPQKTFSAHSGISGNNGSIGGNGTSGMDGSDAWKMGQDGGDGGYGGSGGNGSAGKIGSKSSATGGRGGDGSDGGNAGNGKHGGDGGDGHHGDNGGRGHHGIHGDNGPDLSISIRPIYSPFYLGESLVYMEVTSPVSTQNYIFHQGQSFSISTIGGAGGNGGNGGNGGDGGQGGDGGRGGNGGNGGSGGSGGSGGPANSLSNPPVNAGPQGNGGDGGRGGNGGNAGSGGNGATGGCGGDGGDGGRGGNGGDITIKVYGSSSFQDAVTSALSFQSIPGDGGRKGITGSQGSQGRAGFGGSAGSSGSAGSAGSGSKSGRSGSSGSSGNSGSTGYRIGSLFCYSEAGRYGNRGTSGKTRIQRIMQ